MDRFVISHLTGYQEYYSDDGILYALEDAIFNEIWGEDDENDEDYVVDVSGIFIKKILEEMKKNGAISESQYTLLLTEFSSEEETNNVESLSKSEQEEKIWYELACNNDVAEFYFLHCLNSKSKKAELLTCCIDNGDSERVNYILSLMEKTQTYEDFYERNGWAYDIEVILKNIIQEYDKRIHRSYPVYTPGKDIDIVYDIVDKMLPLLADTSKKNIRNAMISIRPDTTAEQQYIEQLVEDAHIYCMKRKPRGKGGAQNTNRMSQEFIDCFERLEQMKRLDVVVEIMTIFKNAEQIKPIPYENWLLFMRGGLSQDAYQEVIKHL